MLSIDRTWYIGPVYIDLCGGIGHLPLEIGIVISWDGRPDSVWGRRVTLHLGWWALTIGYEPKETEVSDATQS